MVGLLGMAYPIIVQENVVFKKTHDISITQSQWLITFVIDLVPYEQFLNELAGDIGNISITTSQLQKYPSKDRNKFSDTFSRLAIEVSTLQDTYNFIRESFTEHNVLSKKVKRSIFSFVGSAMSFLFGTVSESDLKSIRANIHSLAVNQQEISHVLQESLTIINVSRSQIADNRQTINTLITGMAMLSLELRKLTKDIDRDLKELEEFTQLYIQVDLAIEEIKQMVQRAALYIDNFRVQLDMLSLNRLTPSILSPMTLKKLLIDIGTRMPRTLTLPDDPERNLWKFYKLLTTTTVVETDRLIVIIPIPLFDSKGKFEVFEALSFPMPLQHENKTIMAETDITARYILEADALIINQERSQYSLLTGLELENCKQPLKGFCKLTNGLMPVNLSKTCITALFLKIEMDIRKFCERVINTNVRLPMAKHIDNGLWIITTNKQVSFSMTCHNAANTGPSIIIEPPIGTMQLSGTCTAVSSHITLLPFITYKSHARVEDSARELLKLTNTTNLKLWEPFYKALPNYTKLIIPDKLADMQEIPMQHLISRIQLLRPMEKETEGWSTWVYILIGSGVIALIGFGIFLSIKCKAFPNCLAMISGQRKNAPPQPGKRTVSTKLDGTITTAESQLHSAPLLEKLPRGETATVQNVIKHLYPALDIVSEGR